MLAESRETIRQNIQLEEVNGSFHIEAQDKRYDPAMIHDVSVSGVGVQLEEPLEVGTHVDLIFAAGDWKISVEGRVIWCSIAKKLDLPVVKAAEAYRLGIKFNPRNVNNNVIFFMASRSMVNPHM